MPSFSVFTNRRGLPSRQGGLAALAWPLTLIVLALTSFGGDDATGPLLGGLLLLVAAPTTWLVELLGASSTVSIAVGVATSLPLWFRLGTSLAVRSDSWKQWWRRYLLAAVGWMVALFTIMAIIAGF